MSTSHKGFIAPLLLILIAIFLLSGGAYVYVQNKQTASTAQTADWETYTDLQQDFTFKYPAEWSLKETTTSVDMVGIVRKITLNKSGYTVSIAITDKPYGGEAVSPNDTISVVTIGNQKIFRHKNPVMQEVGTDWYFNLIVYESTKPYSYNAAGKLDLYSFSLKHNAKYYSISYLLPKGVGGNDYNRDLISEADRIIPTFKFISPAVQTSPAQTSEPIGILLPVICKIVGLVGDANHPYTNDSRFGEGTWLVDCGSKNNGNARATIGPVLVQQGWKFCDSGLAGATWWKDGVITGVFEGSSYPGGFFGLSQNNGPSCQ